MDKYVKDKHKKSKELQDQRTDYLHESIRSGNVAQVCRILRCDSSAVNDYNLQFETPLRVTYDLIIDANPEIVDKGMKIFQLLVDHGVDVNIHSNSYLLEHAVEKQQIDGVKLLLKHKADPDVRYDSDYGSALYFAVLENSQEIVRLLLNSKADPSIPDFSGRTPLCVAVEHKALNHMQILLDYGAKINDIYRCLLEACIKTVNDDEPSSKERFKEVFLFLLDHATEMDVHGTFTPEALLYYITSERYGENEEVLLVKWLEERGIFYNDLGDAELHLAAREKDVAAIEALLKNETDVNVANLYGETPLHCLLRNRLDFEFEYDAHYRIARLFIEHGANLQVRNFFDETPFYLATKHYADNIVNLMLATITNVDETTLKIYPDEIMMPYLVNRYNKNETNLHELIVAVSLRHEQVVDRLLNMDFIIGAKNICRNDVNTALSKAVYRGSYDIVRMLLEAGFRADENFTGLSFDTENRQNCEISCLLWEFNGSSAIFHQMTDAIFDVLRGGFPNKLTYLLIFYYALASRMNIMDTNLKTLNSIFKLHKELSLILANCNDKLDKLMKFKLHNESIFNVITMPLDSLVKLLNDDCYLDACTNFLWSLENEKYNLEYHEQVITIRLDLAIEKRTFLNAAKDFFNDVTQEVLRPMNFESLPDEIVWNIFDHLNMRELKKFTNYPV